MSKHKPKLNFRNILSLVGVVGLLAVLLLNRHELSSFAHLLGKLKWYMVILIIATQIFSYYVNAYYYRSILRIFSYEINIRRLFEGALATNFVNYIIPSAGLAGAGYLSQVLHPDVPRGQSVLMQLMRYALTALAVLFMLPIGLLLVLINSNAGETIVRVSIYSSIGIVLFAFAIVWLVNEEKILRRIIKWGLKTIKRFRPSFNKQKSVNYFVDEFFTGFRIMSHKKLRMLLPFLWSVLYILVEMATVYFAFLAFGKVVNPGIVIMGYLFANVASIFGGILFSAGVFELGMIGTFVALGIPFVLSFSVTLVYRTLNLLIGLPAGYFYYKKYLPKH